MKGIIFNIDEFAVHDGPGIRTAVFFKGCPLRCIWCHSPEGLIPKQQILKNTVRCTQCGFCKANCPNPEHCTLCRTCIIHCGKDCLYLSGIEYDATELAVKIKHNEQAFVMSGGGVTLTGGEVFMQPDFLLTLLQNLYPLHRTVETCGFGDSAVFNKMLQHVELVYFDIKHMDDSIHRKYTGQSNSLILENARSLIESDVQFIVRVPFISGINDDELNLFAMANFLREAKNLQFIELLPYNKMAGAKYAAAGLCYSQSFVSPDENIVHLAHDIFADAGIKCVGMGL